MANKLQERFPEIRTRAQILQEIYGNSHLLNRYQEWEPERQEMFLDMFTGVRGVKVLYDSFFKIVLNPDEIPGRLLFCGSADAPVQTGKTGKESEE